MSAPFSSKIVLESILVATWKAILAGKLAFITPVITSTDGLCVATIKWIPTALASWANLAIGASTSLGLYIIKSASSSIIKIIYGIKSFLDFFIISLYSEIFLLPASANKSYLESISFSRDLNAKIALSFLVMIDSSMPLNFNK